MLLWALLLYHARACCSRASTVLHCHKHAQHSAICPHKAAKQVRADQSATTQATREAYTVLKCGKHSTAQSARTKPQSKHVPIRARQHKQADRVGEPAHVEHLYSTLSSQNERRNRILPKGFAFSSFDLSKILFVQHCSFSVLSMYFVHACGVPVVIPEHGALGNCKSSVCT